MKPSQVMNTVKFGPTVLNFGYDFFLLVPFFGTPCTLEGFSKGAKIMLHAHTHYYAAALGGKVTVLQSLVITPTLHLKSKIDKNTGAA